MADHSVVVIITRASAWRSRRASSMTTQFSSARLSALACALPAPVTATGHVLPAPFHLDPNDWRHPAVITE